MDQSIEGMAPVPAKMGWPKWVKVLLGLVVFAAVIVAAGFAFTADASKVANNQIALIKAGDIKGAYDLTSKAFQAATTFAQFEDFVKKATPLSNYKEYSFTDRKVENDLATLSGTTVAQNGTVYKLEYRLVKEDGVWKVLGIDVNVK